MHRSFLDLLACPRCPHSAPLEAEAETEADGRILSGKLTCGDCGAEFPIRDGVPRFVDAADDYCANFGFQWNEWKTLQVDRFAGHGLSETRFLNDSRWSPDWLEGKLILDAGCGAGRFADVAAGFGARVVAVDISTAVDACRDNTADRGDRVACLQASLFELPLREGVFDAVYCMGVIQHTPDPEGLMASLPAFLKPAGRLAYNFYEEGIWRRLQVIKYGLRLFTPHLSVPATLALSRFLVGLFFPLTRFLSGIRKIRIINHFIPIAAVHDPALSRDQQYAWTLLDTFDWYGARYEKRQDHRRVMEILRETGLEQVDGRAGLAWGRKPQD